MNIIAAFNTFKDQWLGRRVDFDHVFNYQCVDLVLQYCYQVFNLRGERGNAIDYWTNPSATLFPTFQKVQTTDVKIGDIVILNGLAGNPYGHIGVGTGNETETTVEILEQNGQTGNGDGEGGNAIRTRYVAKNRIAGVLRPTTVTYGEPEQAAASYHVIKAIPGYGDSNHAANHITPIDSVEAGDYFVFNEAHGMVNVTKAPGQPGNWINPADNVADPAPAPAAEPAAPQLPTKPANIIFSKLAAPLNVVVNKDPTQVWHLDFADDAHAVSAGAVAKGTPFTAFGKAQRTDGDKPCYYMTEADFGAADVTGIPANNVGINTVDISAAPAPVVEAPAEPAVAPPAATESEAVSVPVTVKTWQDSFVPEFGTYKATKDYTVKDLAGVEPDQQLGHDVLVKVAGWVTKDGQEYAITVKSHNLGHWYGIPKSILVVSSGSQVIDAVTHPASTAHAIADDIDKIAAELNKDPEYQQFKQTLTPRGKLVADIAEAEDKVAGIVSKVNFFKRKYQK